MDILIVLLVAAAVFGLCFLLDKGFTKTFRGKQQHQSGLSVRLNKRYGSIGLIIAVLGIAAILAGIPGNWFLIGCGILLALIGLSLVVYYMSFGVYYDDNGFLLTVFGRKAKVYAYRDICSQQLYNSYGNVLIELHLSDGRSVQLQSSMSGVYPFLDKAFSGWLAQTGRSREECPFYDPDNSCWFPNVEG